MVVSFKAPMLLSLLATTTAFIQVQSPYYLGRYTHVINKINVRNPVLLEQNNDLDHHISKVLMKEREELSNNIGNEQLVRKVLLSSRLPALHFLNRSEVRQSGLLGAGRGLFASEDISDGQVITCYPGDALLCKSEDGGEEFQWGTHVPKSYIWDEEAVFVGTESTPPLTSYSVSVDNQYSVLGHPLMDDNPAYYGHYANDGAYLDKLTASLS